MDIVNMHSSLDMRFYHRQSRPLEAYGNTGRKKWLYNKNKLWVNILCLVFCNRAQLVNSSWTALYESRGMESDHHKLFMRYSGEMSI